MGSRREVYVYDHATIVAWPVGDGITEDELEVAAVAVCRTEIVARMCEQAEAERGQFDPDDIVWRLHPARPGFDDPPGARVLAAHVSLDL